MILLVFPSELVRTQNFGNRGAPMANKQPNPEEMVTKLREVEVLTGQGKSNLSAAIPSS